jgi:hypothetical protein
MEIAETFEEIAKRFEDAEHDLENPQDNRRHDRIQTKNPGARFLSTREFKRRFPGERKWTRASLTVRDALQRGRQDGLDKRGVVPLC